MLQYLDIFKIDPALPGYFQKRSSRAFKCIFLCSEDGKLHKFFKSTAEERIPPEHIDFRGELSGFQILQLF